MRFIALLLFISLQFRVVGQHHQSQVHRNHYYSLEEDTLVHRLWGKAGIKKVTTRYENSAHATMLLDKRGNSIETETCPRGCRGNRFTYDAKGRLIEELEFPEGLRQDPRTKAMLEQMTKELAKIPEQQKAAYETLISEMNKQPAVKSRNRFFYQDKPGVDTFLLETRESVNPNNHTAVEWCLTSKKRTWKTGDTTFVATYRPAGSYSNCNNIRLKLQLLEKTYKWGDATRYDNLAYSDGKLANFWIFYEIANQSRILQTGQYNLLPVREKALKVFPDLNKSLDWYGFENQTSNNWSLERVSQIYKLTLQIPALEKINYVNYTYDKNGLLTGTLDLTGDGAEVIRYPDGRVKEWLSKEDGAIEWKTEIRYDLKKLPTEILTYRRSDDDGKNELDELITITYNEK